MKIAVMNYTGTVGKTTIAAHLLAPRIPGAQVFAVESINETAESLGTAVDQIRAERFRDLLRKLVTLDDAIVDVGASNIEGFLDALRRFEGAHLEFDRFVVPVTPGVKQQKETAAMLTALSAFGIQGDQIRVVLNRVEHDAKEEFPMLMQFLKTTECAPVPTAFIYDNEIFDLLATLNMSIGQALADTVDHKVEARKAREGGDKKAQYFHEDMIILKALSGPCARNLDSVFQEIVA
ncbi:uncharacterized protein E1O_18520 [Burkholderiales bacterium GJ-E10]|nr:uncharacterized protein E1O_18520 [Burkholderiales bacterium GJ-E10]